jgi:predicted metal-dependent phosphoesterase TrpH
MIGDLHCHTQLSDGSMSIDDLIFYAKRAGLDFIAVTDHDTMDGVARAEVLGRRYGINVLPAVELSCKDHGRNRKAHILCYLPDKPDRLQGICAQMLDSRTKAGKRIIRAVMRYYPVTEEHIARYTLGSKSIYKSHIIRALLDLGYDNQSHGSLYKELFDSETGICARECEYPDVYDALEIVHSAGGLAVLAHPPLYGSMELLGDLCEQKLLHGVEAFHPQVSGEDAKKIQEIAGEYGLFKTGGSDFHGFLTGRPNPLATRITTEDTLNAMYQLKKSMSKAK